jgi:hypothetical protein
MGGARTARRVATPGGGTPQGPSGGLAKPRPVPTPSARAGRLVKARGAAVLDSRFPFDSVLGGGVYVGN